MSLTHATGADGAPLSLGPAPIPCEALRPLMGERFQLPCQDPWLLDGSSPGHTYLDAAQDAWRDHPEWMDFLDEDSPAWDIKRAARDLYLHRLLPLLHRPLDVLDVGCGVGRLTQPLLDRGCRVWGVDGDLQSLQRCAWHAAGRDGALELLWSTPTTLPAVEVDLAIACELLCYLDDPGAALAAIAARVRPGGHVLVTVEARWGWACAPDAPVDGLEAALGGPALLHLPGDRYVHLFERDDVQALLERAGLSLVSLEPTHYLPDGPLEGLLPETASLEELLEHERRLAEHPVWGPLNRIWTAVAQRPG